MIRKLSDWFAANAVRYQDEAKVKLTYLGFAYDALGEMVTVDEQAIVDYYEQHLPEYQIPEQRRARHILLQASETDSDQIHEEKTSACRATQRAVAYRRRLFRTGNLLLGRAHRAKRW
jgi:peptidyl-prolyl cis-trans isomerase D